MFQDTMPPLLRIRDREFNYLRKWVKAKVSSSTGTPFPWKILWGSIFEIKDTTRCRIYPRYVPGYIHLGR